jgi:hypothetical protein
MLGPEPALPSMKHTQHSARVDELIQSFRVCRARIGMKWYLGHPQPLCWQDYGSGAPRQKWTRLHSWCTLAAGRHHHSETLSFVELSCADFAIMHTLCTPHSRHLHDGVHRVCRVAPTLVHYSAGQWTLMRTNRMAQPIAVSANSCSANS